MNYYISAGQETDGEMLKITVTTKEADRFTKSQRRKVQTQKHQLTRVTVWTEEKKYVHLCNSIVCLCVAKHINLQGQKGVCVCVCDPDTCMHEETDP